MNLKPPAQTKSNRPELFVKISRKGTASTLGKLEIYWHSEAGEERRIGRITNMNIFNEVSERRVSVPLSEMPLGAGKLRVKYFEDTPSGRVFDETSLTL